MQTPSLYSWCSRWFPHHERSTVMAIISSGNQIASVLGNPLIALLCKARLFGGWPSIFYVTALLPLPMNIYIIAAGLTRARTG